jgi:hypothetical protein
MALSSAGSEEVIAAILTIALNNRDGREAIHEGYYSWAYYLMSGQNTRDALIITDIERELIWDSPY